MSSLFRKVDKTNVPVKQSKYEKYGFTRNPFPPKPGVMIDSPDTRENGSIYLAELRKNEEAKFEQLMVPHPERAQVKPITFLMDYATRRGRGIGKTAFLQQQCRRINKDHGAELSGDSQVLFAIYLLPSPGGRNSKFWQFIKLIIQSIVKQDVLAQAMWRMRAFSDCIPVDVLTDIGDHPENTIGNDAWLKNKGVDVNWDLRSYLKAKLDVLGFSEEQREEIIFFGHNPTEFEEKALKNKTDFFWKKEVGIQYFDALVSLLREAGFTKSLIFVDEVEKIVTPQNTQERRSFVESLRYYFIDGQSESSKYSFFNILLTIHPYVQELLNPHWETAGLDRFASLSGDQSELYTIYFDPLKEEFAIPLALEYLNASRIEPDKIGSLNPFTEESIEEALFLSGRVPGIFLTILSNSVELAIQDELDEIDKQHISKVAKSRAPVEPKEKDDIESLSPPKVNLMD
ncbi:hypothetical protein [Desulfogranum japonicum]|uniref:hypothetical protein n=1 Tax=Desulfogranum japonicum TaxID=231447 RepID=UPI000405F55D|nr:hypothetical protein [Desulfogranum japonicum]